MPLGLTIGQPPPNGVVVIGETTLVSGTATGTGGAEPVLVDSVTIRIGGGPIVAAGLSHVGLARNFKAEVVVPGPPGPVAVTVTAHFDGNRVLTKTVTAIATEGALTGCWLSDDGMLFFLNQNGNTLWWVGLDQGPGLQGQGLAVTTVFQGAVNPVTTTKPEATATAGPPVGIPPVALGIQGAWADVPRGTRLLSGTLILEPDINPGGPVQVLKVAAQTGGFTASKLTRVVFTPPQQADIQSLFHLVHKNLSDDETLASEGGILDMPNLTVYKDPVVVFGTVAADASGVSMVVNRRPTDGVAYQDFICTHGGGSLDCDLNFDLILDFDRLDPNFWTEGWEPGVDPQNFLAKVNSSSGRLHLESIMFGRNASCSQPDSYNDPALLPGWQEMGGDSVLINGRPLNGALELQLDPGHTPPPLQVTAIGGKTIRILDTVRVTGALVLDCGHGLTFDRCKASDASYANQEIHPVYAIDLIDATSQDDLTGVWGDNFDMTYYLNQVGDTVWWFGMGPFRNSSFAQVFRGVATKGTIAGSWQDVPLATGVSAEALELAIDVTRTLLTPISSASLSDRRWMKLYDAGVLSTIEAVPDQAAE
jgi:hypothetical protein